MEKVFSLSQKTVSISSLKNLEKTEKCPFQTLRIFNMNSDKFKIIF